MNELELVKTVSSFGGIGVLAIFMWWNAKQATAERQTITDRFLLYQEKNAEGQRQLIREVVSSINMNTDSVNRLTEMNTKEHHDTVAALSRLIDHIDQLAKRHE